MRRNPDLPGGSRSGIGDRLKAVRCGGRVEETALRDGPAPDVAAPASRESAVMRIRAPSATAIAAGGEEHAFDPAAFGGGEDAGGEGAKANAVTGLGEAAERALDQTPDRVTGVAAVKMDAVILEIEQRGVATADDAAVGEQTDPAG